VQARQHYAPGSDRHGFRIERRQAAGNHVGIDELVDRESPLQQRRRSSRLPGAIWAGENHDAGTHVTQLNSTPYHPATLHDWPLVVDELAARARGWARTPA
jgi:hypothetical protein